MDATKVPSFEDSFHDYCASNKIGLADSGANPNDDGIVYSDLIIEDSVPHEADFIVDDHGVLIVDGEEENNLPPQNDNIDQSGQWRTFLYEDRTFSSISEVELFMASYMDLSKSSFVKASNNARQVNHYLLIEYLNQNIV